MSHEHNELIKHNEQRSKRSFVTAVAKLTVPIVSQLSPPNAFPM